MPYEKLLFTNGDTNTVQIKSLTIIIRSIYAPTVVSMFIFCAAIAACSRSAPIEQEITNNQTDTPAVLSAEPLWPELEGIESIISTDMGWPRVVESSEGRIIIERPPQRVLALSVGHNEILFGLLGNSDRFAGIGLYSSDPLYSNVADLTTGLTEVPLDVEQVLAVEPDLVIVSKFTDHDAATLIQETGLNLFRSSLENSAEGNVSNVLLLGYMLGEEERAVELANHIRDRLKFVEDIVRDEDAPSVLMATNYGDNIWVAGTDTTEGGIVETAGGANAAAEIESHMTVSIEGIAAMNPDVIIIPQAEGGQPFKELLLSELALAQTPAVVNGKIYTVDSRHYTTLSYWNICGIEDTLELIHADILPNDFQACEPFS